MARTLASPHRIRCLSRQSHRHSRAHSAPEPGCLRAGDVNRGSRTAGTTGDFPAHASDRAYPAKGGDPLTFRHSGGMSEGRLDLGAPNRAPAAGSGGHAIRGPQSVVTSGMPQQLFHLAYEGCWIATTIIGHCGLNTATAAAIFDFTQPFAVETKHLLERRCSGDLFEVCCARLTC